jgi:diguanylate cyclase (GGDEF)-like protein
LLLDRLEQALVSSERRRRHGALMLIDLDNFKTLNDTQGHDMGDQLLVEVAARLKSSIREVDTVARFGGDEFVIILEDLDESVMAAMQAESVAVKILALLVDPFMLRSNDAGDDLTLRAHHCTASIGITLFLDQPQTTDDLMKRADTAMYQAKAAGRNTLRFFDPQMQADVSARAALEVDLRKAIVENQFVLFYQAQVDARGKVIGAEALVRWQHPQHGLIPPADFIPMAEETGLILPIGHWVLQTACVQLKAWESSADKRDLTLAVNVSARQFRMPNIVEQILAVVDHAGVRSDRLKLEMTESLLLENPDEIVAKMNTLKARGISFSLDDFGTGYSSLSYLKRLPLDQLKIDQSFVRDVLIDANDATIARTIVALANSLGLAVIAEGVESSGQRDFLAEAGCPTYQGYFFSRPVSLQEFEAFLLKP